MDPLRVWKSSSATPSTRRSPDHCCGEDEDVEVVGSAAGSNRKASGCFGIEVLEAEGAAEDAAVMMEAVRGRMFLMLNG